MRNMEQMGREETSSTEIVERGDKQTLVITKEQENVAGIDLRVTTSVTVKDENGKNIAIEGTRFIPEGWRLIDAKDIKDKENVPQNLKKIWSASRIREDAEHKWQDKLIGLTDPEAKLVLFSANSNKGSLYTLLHELGHAHFHEKKSLTSRHKELAEFINATQNINDIPVEIRQELADLIMENEYQADLWATGMYESIQSKYDINLELDLSNKEILEDLVYKGYQKRMEGLENRLQLTIPNDVFLHYFAQMKETLELNESV